MDHVAILDKSRQLLPKIISGEKTIESRWYVSRFAPWSRIFAEDTIYFKNSGEAVTARATVTKVLQFSDLDKKKIREIISNYGREIGFKSSEVKQWVNSYTASKHYCILIFLKDPKQIKPFRISKAGFGASCAWMCVGTIKGVCL
jgi:hypothetical protein